MKALVPISLVLGVFVCNTVLSEDSRPTEELSLNFEKVKTTPQKSKDGKTEVELKKDVNTQNSQAHKPGGGATGAVRRRGSAITED